jgi:hypothetical protein
MSERLNVCTSVAEAGGARIVRRAGPHPLATLAALSRIRERVAVLSGVRAAPGMRTSLPVVRDARGLNSARIPAGSECPPKATVDAEAHDAVCSYMNGGETQWASIRILCIM